MAWKKINIPPVIIADVAWMVVESSQGQQVAVTHRPPKETNASESVSLMEGHGFVEINTSFSLRRQ